MDYSYGQTLKNHYKTFDHAFLSLSLEYIQFVNLEYLIKAKENLAKQGISGQKGVNKNNDKILFICHGNNPVYHYKVKANHKAINSPSYTHSA